MLAINIDSLINIYIDPIQPPHPSPFNLFILRYLTSLSFAIQPPHPSLFNLTFAKTR